MTNALKRGTAVIISLMVLVVTVLSLLHIWGVLDVTDWFYKAFKSLVVIFISSGVLLFIFAVFFKPDNPAPRGRQTPPPGDF